MCNYPVQQPPRQTLTPGPGSGPRYNYGPRPEGGPPSDSSTETSDTTFVDNGRTGQGAQNPRQFGPGYHPQSRNEMTQNYMGFN